MSKWFLESLLFIIMLGYLYQTGTSISRLLIIIGLVVEVFGGLAIASVDSKKYREKYNFLYPYDELKAGIERLEEEGAIEKNQPGFGMVSNMLRSHGGLISGSVQKIEYEILQEPSEIVSASPSQKAENKETGKGSKSVLVGPKVKRFNKPVEKILYVYRDGIFPSIYGLKKPLREVAADHHKSIIRKRGILFFILGFMIQIFGLI